MIWASGDRPKTGQTGPNAKPSGLKPLRGELFVRQPKGSVLLTQTLKLFGRSKADRNTL